MPEHHAVDTLAPPAASDLVEFARNCRAALHAVGLYPGDHPAIERALARLTAVCRRVAAEGTLRIGVLPADLQLDGRTLPRPEAAAIDLARLFHSHRVGLIAISSEVSAHAWRQLLALVVRSPEDIRDEGGISRVWTAMGFGAMVEVREIDYADLVGDRPAGGERASWNRMLAHCLAQEPGSLDDSDLTALADLVASSERLSEFCATLERVSTSGDRSSAAALLRLLTFAVDAMKGDDPARIDQVYGTMASAVSRLSPEGMLQWLEACARAAEPGDSPSPAAGVLARFDDAHLAQFVTGSIVCSRGATGRLSQAFQALVPDVARRQRLLGLARRGVDESALAREPGFDELWHQVEHMLATYTDSAYVSEAYGEELSRARRQQEHAAQMADDPPERVAAWIGTVSEAALRADDVQLLVDLLTLEEDRGKRRELADLACEQVEELVLLGDVAAARRLVECLATCDRSNTGASDAPPPFTERLLRGQIVSHLVYHLQGASDEEFGDVKQLCHLVGPGVITALAETLAADERARVRERLTDLLVSFGSLGRQSVEQLKQSANPSVRRTAVYLLREFGGRDALPDLERLLNDAEPHVQRDAVRAMLTMATDEAYEALERALGAAGPTALETIFQQFEAAPHHQLAPVLSHLLHHVDHRGRFADVYVRAVGLLGRVGDDEAVEPLVQALARGEWWAPARSANIRRSAAFALRRLGTPRARAALESTLTGGTRGARKAARAALALAIPRRPARSA